MSDFPVRDGDGNKSYLKATATGAYGDPKVISIAVESVAAPSTVRHGQLSVGTSEVQLTAGSVTQGVTVKARSANTGKLYVGVTGVTTSTGYPLSAGDSVFIACDNANRVFVISDTASQTVAWIGS